MIISKKSLQLNYIDNTAAKERKRGFRYEINPNTENAVAKEVGESLASLIDEEIDGFSVSLTETI